MDINRQKGTQIQIVEIPEFFGQFSPTLEFCKRIHQRMDPR